MNDPTEGHRWTAPAADQFEFVFTPVPQPPNSGKLNFHGGTEETGGGRISKRSSGYAAC